MLQPGFLPNFRKHHWTDLIGIVKSERVLTSFWMNKLAVRPALRLDGIANSLKRL